MNIEKSLVILKPDAVERGLIGKILERFENAGLRLVAMKMVVANPDDMRRHYGDWVERYTEKLGLELASTAYKAIVDFMTSGPAVLLVLEGVAGVAVVRKIVGSTYPDQALPGTIRGDFAHVSQAYANGQGLSIKNLVHASGSVEEAVAEISAWFTPAEMYDYEPVHLKHTRK